MELEFNKLEFQPIPSWMKFEIDHKKKKKGGTRVSETRVPLTKIFPPHAFLLIFFQKYAFLQNFALTYILGRPHKYGPVLPI